MSEIHVCPNSSDEILDLTCTHVIFPKYTQEGLSHMPDMVLVNKLHCSGRDYLVSVNIWGTLVVARENITHVPADKVETGRRTESVIVEVARKRMNSNARAIYTIT